MLRQVEMSADLKPNVEKLEEMDVAATSELRKANTKGGATTCVEVTVQRLLSPCRTLR